VRGAREVGAAEVCDLLERARCVSMAERRGEARRGSQSTRRRQRRREARCAMAECRAVVRCLLASCDGPAPPFLPNAACRPRCGGGTAPLCREWCAGAS
jgi:hypothetical protein